ncbi:glycosyltransferase family 4 protein [Pontibacter sp. KCTC 32443]|uniref:glycosyltransferase family 4 protein n=1 Tax=Pontibacter TaxID=323449 RepID=UPI00164D01A6|nr:MULTISPECIES: glycosyltransferase family 4 protein [Pontibacter]MBC5773488.1 glycosyltransferase family 4 protein [Pontibacter sp. KCTC 32443]
MNKLAIITSHPIQYNAPLFRLLAQDNSFAVRVFYTLGRESSDFTDPGFKKTISWDIPLLEGYDYMFVKNTAVNPSTTKFNGIVNPTITNEIESFGATHILVYGWSFNSHLKIIWHFYNKAKIIFRGDSTLLDEKPGFKTLMRRAFLTLVYKHIDVALYVGENNKQYFQKHGVPNRKLLYAPHAIDNDRFSSSEHDIKAAELRRELKIDANRKVFLFTGKFECKKNPKLLINAFKKLNHPETFLLMIGNGALEDELKQLAQESSNIKFLPFQNQSMMPIVYRLGDVLVLPSQGPGETWGLCLNEAMASGLAVVASNKVGGAKDLIDECNNGYIFETDNLNQLIVILDEISNKANEQIKHMGKASQIKVGCWNYHEICSALINYIGK